MTLDNLTLPARLVVHNPCDRPRGGGIQGILVVENYYGSFGYARWAVRWEGQTGTHHLAREELEPLVRRASPAQW